MITPEEPSPLAHAHAYAALGWHVFPVVPGEKRPATQHGLNDATVDPDQIDRWWRRAGWEHHSVGIRTGPESGLWVLDIDVADGKPGMDSFAELEAIHGILPETTMAITGSGGVHLLFAWPDDQVIRNNATALLGAGLDVRGAGGYIVAPPSSHASGGTYRWVASAAPWERPPAEAPAWLLELLSSPTIDSRASDEGPKPPLDPDDDGAAAHFNANTTWAQLLETDSWTLHQTLADGEQRWVRPGKDGHEGHSATVGHEGRDCLKVFTSSVPGLDADRAYSRFGYHAAIHHHGDRSAAARSIRAGMPTTAPDVDLSWIDLDPADPGPQPPPAHTFPDQPDPLIHATSHGPPFPLDTLPTWIADQCREVVESFQVPADLPAMLALGALSIVCAGHVKVNLTGSMWTEHTNLYLVTAMPPGAGKSPVYKVMVGAVTLLEKESMRFAKDRVRKAEIERETYETQAKAAKAAAAKDAGRILEAIDLQKRADDVEIPGEGRLIGEDITPEALVEELAANGGRLALLSSEGGVFDMMAGQYVDKGKAANLAVYLQGWSADSIRRKRTKGATTVIDEAVLSICVTTQPDVIGHLGANPELAGRGLPARFMYSIPARLVGWRNRAAVLRDLGADIATSYNDTLLEIGRRCASWQTPITLQLTIDARQRFIAWDQQLEERQRPGRDLADRAEWASKLRATILRLAGLLHIADGHRHDDPVELDTLERAITIGAYWTDHADVVHGMWEIEAELSQARQIVEWAITNGPTFTSSDLQKKMRRTFPVIADVVAPLTQLVEGGWIRPEHGMPIVVGRRGVEAPTFTLRPDAAELIATVGIGTVEREWDTTEPETGAAVDDIGSFALVLKEGVSTSLSSQTNSPPPPRDPSANGANDPTPSTDPDEPGLSLI